MLAGVWQNLRVESVSGAGLEGLAPAWRRLSRGAMEHSGFNSADFAVPILAQGQSAKVECVGDESRLLMAVPARAGRSHDTSLTSDLHASGLPEVNAALAPEAILAFLNGRQRPFLFKAVPTDSFFFGQLQVLAPQIQVLAKWKRAALRLEGSFEDWMAQNFDHKRRKELKRLRNRLAEQGDLKFESLSLSSSLPRFIDGLLELESQGWKGERGTALKADEAKGTMFRQVCENLLESGALRFWQLTLNGKPVASLFGMVEGAQGWIVKIAYDEAFARYSPGVLLVIEATAALFAEGGVKLVDSCAIAGHPMIERIWRDRIEMVDVLVAPASVSALQFNLVKAALAAHGALRARAKSAFHAITKRKRS